ncbi:methyltransferase domain-containing protein [Streptomyces sp. LP05-1]|uniref:Protein-L-isoaspartate O-methyltransferase n=1 Tax=Streptomyces pyxinae TaxID=2970734 RepID=A0ABT2CEV4_9ACTN|nr:methyltransferase domain-containing protein [Streptomyces sp. LP05-1]MCS0635949.1 methyltransferase domain-containing protein [Streptomyces sp. LP05-1]
MNHSEAARQTALRALSREITHDLGKPLEPAWDKVFWTVPRERFLPDLIHQGPDLTPIDRSTDPERWFWAAYGDEPAITQLNGGDEPGAGEVRWASSSVPAPSVAFRMLDMLDVRDGHQVLEIGTGTGWNAALLAQRVGAENVTSVEVDPLLAVRAAEKLRENGQDVEVIFGDGAVGHPRNAPYRRVVATCSVRRVPYAWIEQTKPGGIVLTPWSSPWFDYGLLRLTVDGHGLASGWFAPDAVCAPLAQQRSYGMDLRNLVRQEGAAERSFTRLSPWAVTGDEWSARFAVGLQARDVRHVWDEDGPALRLWLATTDATSWAAVDDNGGGEGRYAVRQFGVRRLWDEVVAAYHWWRGAGEPGPGRFGLTVHPGGGHVPWLDTPDRPVPVTG